MPRRKGRKNKVPSKNDDPEHLADLADDDSDVDFAMDLWTDFIWGVFELNKMTGAAVTTTMETVKSTVYPVKEQAYTYYDYMVGTQENSKVPHYTPRFNNI